jgi:hypothetical protein
LPMLRAAVSAAGPAGEAADAGVVSVCSAVAIDPVLRVPGDMDDTLCLPAGLKA